MKEKKKETFDVQSIILISPSISHLGLFFFLMFVGYMKYIVYIVHRYMYVYNTAVYVLYINLSLNLQTNQPNKEFNIFHRIEKSDVNLYICIFVYVFMCIFIQYIFVGNQSGSS